MVDEAPLPARIGKYQILELIGSGAFATVHKAQHNVTMSIVALKAIAKSNLRTMQEFELLQREVNLMKMMDHPFIAPLYEVLDDDTYFYLAIELVENGNLLDFINTRKGLSEDSARRIFFQIMSVLDYLHREKRIVHRDLKAENVLLDQYDNIRVVDFGLSKSFSKSNPFLQTTCGSPAYVSPEIIREEPYTAAADVWASGVLLYAMVCGTLPFDGENMSGLLQAILSATPSLPSHVSPELRGLLGRLLMKDPKARITVKQVLEHQWLADIGQASMVSIIQMKVQDAHELDDAVLSEMRALGYDVGGLLQDLRNYVFTERTAAYRMLRRRRILDEIHKLGDSKPRKGSHELEGDSSAREKLPTLDFVRSTSKRRRDSLAPPNQALPRLGQAPKVRKRTTRRSGDLPPVSFGALG
jgi:serine/threonine protein kinase